VSNELQIVKTIQYISKKYATTNPATHSYGDYWKFEYLRLELAIISSQHLNSEIAINKSFGAFNSAFDSVFGGFE
jgi:hypothetical protein